jgi:NADH dehydrogenase
MSAIEVYATCGGTSVTTWLITGANGNLGRRLITTLLKEPNTRVRAVVRSQSAAATISNLPLIDDSPDARTRLHIAVLNYTDEVALTEAARSCDVAVHLVGILKESSTSTYVDAHEHSGDALVGACKAAGVGHIVYLSIVGAAASSTNACLASKGRAEERIRAFGKTTVLRVPMVLGEGDYASRALYYRAIKPRSFTFRAASKEQPVYAGDVVRAIVRAGELGIDGSIDLGGPEILSREALTQRAAASLNRHTRVVSLPVGLGMAIGWVLEKVSANPPLTRAMLGVLDHDDDVDCEPAMRILGLDQLTSLNEMLRNVLVSQT